MPLNARRICDLEDITGCHERRSREPYKTELTCPFSNSPRVIRVSMVLRVSGSESLSGRVRRIAGIGLLLSGLVSENEIISPRLLMARASGYEFNEDLISDCIIPQSLVWSE